MHHPAIGGEHLTLFGIHPFVTRSARTGRAALLTLGLLAAGTITAAQLQNPDEKPGAWLTPRGRPLSAEARKQTLQWVVTHPAVTGQAPGHRLAGIRLTLGSATNASGETRTIVTAVLFDHTAGEARRVMIDGVSGEVLANELLPGRPQSSREEFDEATQIIRRDPELARLLDEGGILDGGFIVSDPAGSRRRMIQLKLLTRDRLSLLRSITVDLTRRVMATPSDERRGASAVPVIRPATRPAGAGR